jgi:cysteine protease ATG4
MYHILGKPVKSPILQDLYYTCYRNGFPSYKGFTDDVGWGCTLRCFQMIVANFLANLGVVEPETYIYDDPMVSPFALQRLISIGSTKYEIELGEWYNPSTATKILQNCLNSNYNKSYPLFPAKIMIHGIDNLSEFLYPLLLLFPVRLGIDKLEKIYHENLLDFLQHPCSMGFIGGKRSSAYYIVGSTSNNKLVYMDPHDLRKHNDHNYKCQKLYDNLTFEKLDPSIAIACILKNQQQYNDIITTYSNIFDTCQKDQIETDVYSYLDEDDGFCLVLDNTT